jgi:hypothetical protein
MNERWTFTEAWESWAAGDSIYPNGVLSRSQFVILRDKGALVLASDYKPKLKAVATKAAEAPRVTKPRKLTSVAKKESVNQ